MSSTAGITTSPRPSQHLTATIHLAGQPEYTVTTHGDGHASPGSHIIVTAGDCLIYLHDRWAARTYAGAWLSKHTDAMAATLRSNSRCPPGSPNSPGSHPPWSSTPPAPTTPPAGPTGAASTSASAASPGSAETATPTPANSTSGTPSSPSPGSSSQNPNQPAQPSTDHPDPAGEHTHNSPTGPRPGAGGGGIRRPGMKGAARPAEGGVGRVASMDATRSRPTIGGRRHDRLHGYHGRA